MITLQFEWSWFSFIVGAVSAFALLFVVALTASFRQWKKQKKSATAQVDAFEAMVNDWKSTNNK